MLLPAYANFIGDLADAAEAKRQRTAARTSAGADPAHKIDKFAIAQAIGADSRVGLKCLLPGYGFGGPCFPRDGRALASFAGQVSSSDATLDTGILTVPSLANDAHARFQAQQLVRAADAMLRQGKVACTIVFDDVTFKPRCAVPIVQESQKLVIARIVRGTSEHSVAIREGRTDILDAVRRDFGILFEYWQLHEGELPVGHDPAVGVVVADDELLPKRAGGESVRVPATSSAAMAGDGGAKRRRSDGLLDHALDGRTSVSTSFTK